ncbi:MULTISPECIES: DUF5685 family protein [Tsukamurella]|uniref:Regulator n=2 Tax=Tsukamurella TaxID=2060 RepID=A0A846X2I1_9ACTN|nr:MULTISPECIES: DUF5685 family protein [Tsukamurella]KXP06711.1 hypothetical protein AXK60_11635 [Tsukamurella pseudospumae]NKY19827.1 regulator [Tsukamurella spumae]
MLGLVRPCVAHLEPELRARWRAHLCGLCLKLRETGGQPARVATNTDAAMLSALVEAQQGVPASTRSAGPCVLRGMRGAEVIAPSELGVRLASTASLTLAAAKLGDRVAEQEFGLAGRTSVVGRRTVELVRRAERRLAGGAVADAAVAEAARVSDSLRGLADQARIEARATSLADVTAPTAQAVGEMFAASATLAGRPENVVPLSELGRAYGEFAHLADAVEDLPGDRARGDYNPLDATGTTVEQAVDRLKVLQGIVIDRLGRVRMRDDRLVRPLLLTAMATVLAANGVSLDKKAKKKEGRRSAGAGENAGDCCCDGDCCCGDGCCCDCS